MLTDWSILRVSEDATIRSAMEKIDESGLQIALIADEAGHLKGVLTDGDIRRAILRGQSLDSEAHTVMNDDPVTLPVGGSRADALSLMKEKRIHQIPIIDAEGRVVGIEVIDDLLDHDVPRATPSPRKRDNPVVLMAGGLGTRLRPLTEETPKPLLEVGDRPILETILDRLIQSGFHRFYVSVNYKADMIEDYFGDGSSRGVDITYIHEDQRLGTAGPLSLLSDRPDRPFLVMNGDLLTTLNFGQLLDFHEEYQSVATMCVREYDMQVPYGVIETDEHRLVDLKEKPVHSFFVNAGIYVLNPETLDYIPDGEFYDMPTLFENVIEDDKAATVFPVREYWQDIGRMEQFERANGEFEDVFR